MSNELVAALEERIKDLQFEVRDRDYTIKELKAEIRRLLPASSQNGGNCEESGGERPR